MKNILTLNSGWRLKRINPIEKIDSSQLVNILKDGTEPRDKFFHIKSFPTQVYEILIAEDIIENPNIHGDSAACQWVGESDWLYINEFDYIPSNKNVRIDFQGLDTFADIYLNGEYLASHEDVYLPHEIDISGKMKNHNQLMIHFHSPKKKYDEVILPAYIHNIEDKIKPGARTRMFGSTLIDYLGPKPCLFRVGVYGEIQIIETDRAEIAGLHTSYKLDEDFKAVILYTEITLEGNVDSARVYLKLTSPDGKVLRDGEVKINPESKTASGSFIINQPELWFPRTHGKSPLYSVQAELSFDETLLDTKQQKIGIRSLKRIGDFDFTINGLPLKIYGSNLAPTDTLTNVYNAKRMNQLLDLAEHSHQNCLRVWGENEKLHDAFYEECDKRGILIWQDFFTTHSMYVPDPHMYSLIRQEAEYQVLRLRDHPCIWLWCGGNEGLMFADHEYPNEEYLGLEIFNEIFPSVCSALDPERYYHRSSPDGGSYPNDPLAGDTHGYTHIWYVPGNEYPVFLSENNRVSTPAKRTMKRMMKEEDLWPAGYDGLQHKNNELLWPETWNKYNSSQGYWKVGKIESYYDAEDLDSMLYRIGWAHGDYLRRSIERYRRGIPQADGSGKRVTKGHILWKFNNSCNHIFFGVIDYFLEPYIAYYSAKRAYQPVLLSFNVGNFIDLWMVNDTIHELEGRIFIGLFNPKENRIVKSFDVPFKTAPDKSKWICDCNRFGQFKSNNILYAYAVTNDGKRIAESFDYADIERHIRFPTDGKISASIEGNELVLQSDRYERSVELLGNSGGDEFGWLFEDNYFDLIPGIIKRVKIEGKHQKGNISIKGYYSDNETNISY